MKQNNPQPKSLSDTNPEPQSQEINMLDTAEATRHCQ